MIDDHDQRPANKFLFGMTDECSRQCVRRTLFAVLIGVSPIVICLLFIAFARLVLYRLELVYNRRLKPSDRRTSYVPCATGRLALSYTPVSHAELQRIILGDHHRPISNDSTRKTPKFIQSILPRREPALSSTSILANLVIRRDGIDAGSVTGILAPVSTPCHPTFSFVNEKQSRRPSVITIKRESVETTTLASMNASGSSFTSDDSSEYEQANQDPLMGSTKTLTTTTVVVEEFLEFHSVSSLPCTLSVLNSIAENEHDKTSNMERENDF